VVKPNRFDSWWRKTQSHRTLDWLIGKLTGRDSYKDTKDSVGEGQCDPKEGVPCGTETSKKSGESSSV
jgi:hypothetical protein